MRVPKLRKHSSGQGRVTLRGRTFFCGKYGTPQCETEYKRLVGEFIANAGVIIPDRARADLSIAEMMLAYRKWARDYQGNNSGEFDRIKRIIDLTSNNYAALAAADFGYAQYEAVRSVLVARGVGRKYVNECMSRLVRIFRWAASRGLIPHSTPETLSMIEPLRRGRTRASEPRDVLPVAPEVVELTLKHLPGVVADMVRVQSLIGCRPGEL